MVVYCLGFGWVFIFVWSWWVFVLCFFFLFFGVFLGGHCCCLFMEGGLFREKKNILYSVFGCGILKKQLKGSFSEWKKFILTTRVLLRTALLITFCSWSSTLSALLFGTWEETSRLFQVSNICSVLTIPVFRAAVVSVFQVSN